MVILMNSDEMIKKIDEKIAQLEKEERAEFLLRKALFKKGVISTMEAISDDKAEELFTMIGQTLRKE